MFISFYYMYKNNLHQDISMHPECMIINQKNMKHVFAKL